MTTELPRGFLNHNPGNIRRGADGLPGQRIIQTDREHMQFSSAGDGIRALTLVLRGYKTRGIDRLDGLIAQWRRDRDIDADSDMPALAAALGGAPDDPIDLDDRPTLLALVKALMRCELGDDYYTEAEIADGVARAFDLA
jgi:hypothetical protein